MVDVGRRLPDDLEEFGNETEAIRDGFEKRVDINRDLDLS